MHTPQRTHLENDAHDDASEIVGVYELHDDAETDAELIGTMEIDSEGYLTIADVLAARHDLLQQTVEHLNRKATITLLADAPGAEPFATPFVTIARGSAGFIAGLRKYAEAYYGFRLL